MFWTRKPEGYPRFRKLISQKLNSGEKYSCFFVSMAHICACFCNAYPYYGIDCNGDGSPLREQILGVLSTQMVVEVDLLVGTMQGEDEGT